MVRFVAIISAFFALMQPLITTAKTPKLVVLLAVDQLRPERINASMPGGLGRLMREGQVFAEATLDHGLTTTCPGHVVVRP